ncbi:MAG: NAD(P)H-dependent oxidoreductase [Ardenticatenaceae bacterium]|nr:NAD(P)H-dependent oxidoreductase [Ardenticatenaceae bacterium]
MSEVINVVALVGSLRRESHNKALAQTAQSVAPDKMKVTIWPLDDIPVYNNDVEVEQGFPAAVAAMRDALAAADGIIFATPEYNGSVSGVLKNAIDWASRGAAINKTCRHHERLSSGGTRGAKAQEHLRQICLHLGMYVLSAPLIAVPQFHDTKLPMALWPTKLPSVLSAANGDIHDWIVKLK